MRCSCDGLPTNSTPFGPLTHPPPEPPVDPPGAGGPSGVAAFAGALPGVTDPPLARKVDPPNPDEGVAPIADDIDDEEPPAGPKYR